MLIEFTTDGDLRIVGINNLEFFSLQQWEKLRKAGKSKIIIADEPFFDVSEEMKKMGDEIKEFRKWRKEKQGSAPTTDKREV